jgi:hypothetical protein
MQLNASCLCYPLLAQAHCFTVSGDACLCTPKAYLFFSFFIYMS